MPLYISHVHYNFRNKVVHLPPLEDTEKYLDQYELFISKDGKCCTKTTEAH